MSRVIRGGSRIFSRGGGFSKNFPKFWQPFFLGPPNWFFELPQSTVLPLFWLNFLTAFFGARSPSKLVYIGAKGAFRKILGSVGQKWISKKVSKGVESLRGGGRPISPPLPLNQPLRVMIRLCRGMEVSDLVIAICMVLWLWYTGGRFGHHVFCNDSRQNKTTIELFGSALSSGGLTKWIKALKTGRA